jgi:hypothetical protein
MVSKAIAHHFRRLPFWERVRLQTVEHRGCLIFTGVKDECGYGRIRDNRFGKATRAIRLHRAVWERDRGPIPKGLVVCHRCDVRACINPDHLFIGTQGDNIKDMERKGRRRSIRGSQQTQAKLNEPWVLAIKARLRQNETCASIARFYQVSEGLIRHIKQGRKWAHVQ